MSLEKILLKINQWGAALILLAPVFYGRMFVFPYIHLKSVWFRSLMVILIISLVWYLLERGKWRGYKNYVFSALLIFLCVQTLATIFGVNAYNSLWGNYERMQGLIHLFLLGIYFFLLINVFQTKKDWLKLFRVSLLASVGVGVYGLVKNGLEIVSNQWSVIGNSAFLAFYLLLSIFLALICFYWDKNKLWRFFYAAVFIFNLLIMLGAASRAPILGLLVGLIVAALFYFPQASHKVRLIFLLSLIAIFILGAVVYWQKDSLWLNKIHWLDRLIDISYSDETTHNRLYVWQGSWQVFKDRPILGYGPENFHYGFNKHYNPLITEQWFDRAHNFILDYLVFSGILGLLSFLGMLAAAIYYIWKIRLKNILLNSLLNGLIVAYLFTSFFIFDMLNTWLLVMVFLAFISWLGTRHDIQEKECAKFWQKIYYPLLGLVVFCMVIFTYNVIIKPAQANNLSIETERHSRAYIDKTLEFYDQALSLNTFGTREIKLRFCLYASDLITLSDADLSLKNRVFEKAEETMLEHLAENEDDIQARMLLAQTYLAYAKLNTFYADETIRLLESHLVDSPRRIDMYFMIGQAYYLKEDFEQSINYLEQAYAITDEVASVYTNLMNIYSQVGETDKLKQVANQYMQNIKLGTDKYRQLGEYYFRAGLIEESKEILLTKAIPDEPSNWKNYVALASIYEAEEKYQQAANYLKEVLIYYPPFEEIFRPYIQELESK